VPSKKPEKLVKELFGNRESDIMNNTVMFQIRKMNLPKWVLKNVVIV